ncbi:MAG: hypothetical protein ABWX92_18460 [Mycetocola sp.]
MVEPVEPVEPVPATRAERRALQTAALAAVEEPPVPSVPLTRAELRARTKAQHAAADEQRRIDAVAPDARVVEDVTPTPGPGAWPVAQSAADSFPDQILDRSIRTKEDRPLPPVVYLPQPSGYVRVPQSTLVPVTSQNGPAKASMVLILISLLGGAATYWFVSRTNSALAGLLNLLIVAVLLAALGLAVVGLVLAVRRPTKKRESVCALVVSLLLIGGMVALSAMRLISLGAVYSGG